MANSPQGITASKAVVIYWESIR